jgi:signal transduction histidine kinase
MGRSIYNYVFTSDPPREKELKHCRIVLLIGIITHPLIGLIRILDDPTVNDPMSLRLITTFAALAVYLLSFRSSFVIRNFINLMYVLCYAVSIHILYVLLANQLSVNYVTGFFLILVAVSVIFNDEIHLLIYLLFMNAGLIAVSFSVSDPPVQVSVLLSASFTMSLVIYFALRSKITVNRELDKINRLLVKEVAERKTAQEEIQLLNKHLERNVSELESINNDLESFSYSAAHDLKAPLRIISQFSFLFRRRYEKSLDPEGLELLDTVIRSTRDMDKLINDLINFARLGKKELKKEYISMYNLVSSVLSNNFSAELDEKVEIIYGELPEVRVDAVLIQQVFVNLISNALKYSAARERIRIELSSFREKGDTVFFIRDNGAGFDMQYAHKLFLIFQRLHSRDEFEGTGLGLAIVKRIVERHGGRVWAESSVGKGATFYFSIPS